MFREAEELNVSGKALAAGIAPFTVATNLPAASALPLTKYLCHR